MKNELIYHVNFDMRYEARREIFEFIEVIDNRRRMHSYMGYLSPVEFETTATKAA
jgi:putative transposase